MAEVSATQTAVQSKQGDCVIVTWGALNTNNQTAAAVSLPYFGDKSVQIQGSNFDGATIALHGSNDGTNFIVLTDPQGNNISKTSSAIEAVTEHTRYIKPVASGINTNTSVVVTVYARA
jgi:hypothetical protein